MFPFLSRQGVSPSLPPSDPSRPEQYTPHFGRQSPGITRQPSLEVPPSLRCSRQHCTPRAVQADFSVAGPALGPVMKPSAGTLPHLSQDDRSTSVGVSPAGVPLNARVAAGATSHFFRTVSQALTTNGQPQLFPCAPQTSQPVGSQRRAGKSSHPCHLPPRRDGFFRGIRLPELSSMIPPSESLYSEDNGGRLTGLRAETHSVSTGQHSQLPSQSPSLPISPATVSPFTSSSAGISAQPPVFLPIAPDQGHVSRPGQLFLPVGRCCPPMSLASPGQRHPVWPVPQYAFRNGTPDIFVGLNPVSTADKSCLRHGPQLQQTLSQHHLVPYVQRSHATNDEQELHSTSTGQNHGGVTIAASPAPDYYLNGGDSGRQTAKSADVTTMTAHEVARTFGDPSSPCMRARSATSQETDRPEENPAKSTAQSVTRQFFAVTADVHPRRRAGSERASSSFLPQEYRLSVAGASQAGLTPAHSIVSGDADTASSCWRPTPSYPTHACEPDTELAPVPEPSPVCCAREEEDRARRGGPLNAVVQGTSDGLERWQDEHSDQMLEQHGSLYSDGGHSIPPVPSPLYDDTEEDGTEEGGWDPAEGSDQDMCDSAGQRDFSLDEEHGPESETSETEAGDEEEGTSERLVASGDPQGAKEMPGRSVVVYAEQLDSLCLRQGQERHRPMATGTPEASPHYVETKANTTSEVLPSELGIRTDEDDDDGEDAGGDPTTNEVIRMPWATDPCIDVRLPTPTYSRNRDSPISGRPTSEPQYLQPFRGVADLEEFAAGDTPRKLFNTGSHGAILPKSRVEKLERGEQGARTAVGEGGSTKASLPWSKVVVNTKMCRAEKPLINTVAHRLGWTRQEQTNCKDHEHLHYNKPLQIINRFPGMWDMTKKRMLSRILSLYQQLYPDVFDFSPPCWSLPEDRQTIERLLHSRNQEVYILKPDGGAMGNGVQLVTRCRDIDAMVLRGDGNYIMQKYIRNPYLLNKRKFDFRIYCMLLSVSGTPKAFVSHLGMARFCTEEYRTPSRKNIDNPFMHLTNYSINKDNISSFVRSADLHDDNNSKRMLKDVFSDLAKAGVNIANVWQQIKSITARTIVCLYPWLNLRYRHVYRGRSQEASRCFQLLGLDILLDDTEKCWLLEVNSNPSLRIDYFDSKYEGIDVQLESAMDRYIKEPVVSEGLGLVYRLLLQNRHRSGTSSSSLSASKSLQTASTSCCGPAERSPFQTSTNGAAAKPSSRTAHLGVTAADLRKIEDGSAGAPTLSAAFRSREGVSSRGSNAGDVRRPPSRCLLRAPRPIERGNRKLVGRLASGCLIDVEQRRSGTREAGRGAESRLRGLSSSKARTGSGSVKAKGKRGSAMRRQTDEDEGADEEPETGEIGMAQAVEQVRQILEHNAPAVGSLHRAAPRQSSCAPAQHTKHLPPCPPGPASVKSRGVASSVLHSPGESAATTACHTSTRRKVGTDALSQVTTTTSSRAASRGRPCLQANDWKSDDETTASTLVYGPTAVSRLRQVGAAGDPVDVLHDQHCGEPRPLQASDEESLGKGGKDSPRALLSEQGEPGVTGGSPAESARSSDARTSETDLDSSPQCPEAAQLATELEWMDAAYREMEKCMDCFNVLGLRFANSPLPAMSPNGSGAGGSDDDCTMTRGPSAGARKKFHPGPYKPFLKKDRLAAKKKQTAVKASYTKLHKDILHPLPREHAKPHHCWVDLEQAIEHLVVQTTPVLRFQLLFERLVNFPKAITLQRATLLEACRIVRLSDILRKVQVPASNPVRPRLVSTASSRLSSSSSLSSAHCPSFYRGLDHGSGSFGFPRTQSRCSPSSPADTSGESSSAGNASRPSLWSSASTKSLSSGKATTSRARLQGGAPVTASDSSLSATASLVPERRRRLGLQDVEALWCCHLQSVRRQLQLQEASPGLGLLESWYVMEAIALACFPFFPTKAKLLEAFLTAKKIVRGGPFASVKSWGSQCQFEIEEALKKVEEEERRALPWGTQPASRGNTTNTAATGTKCGSSESQTRAAEATQGDSGQNATGEKRSRDGAASAETPDKGRGSPRVGAVGEAGPAGDSALKTCKLLRQIRQHRDSRAHGGEPHACGLHGQQKSVAASFSSESGCRTLGGASVNEARSDCAVASAVWYPADALWSREKLRPCKEGQCGTPSLIDSGTPREIARENEEPVACNCRDNAALGGVDRTRARRRPHDEVRYDGQTAEDHAARSEAVTSGRRLSSMPPGLQRQVRGRAEEPCVTGAQKLHGRYEPDRELFSDETKRPEEGIREEDRGLTYQAGSGLVPTEMPPWHEGLCAAWPDIGEYVQRLVPSEARTAAMERLVDYFQLKWDYHNYCMFVHSGGVSST